MAVLFGLGANATAALAVRAREGLKQAYLQAHVDAAPARSGDCVRHAEQLAAHARGRLRTRAERGLRKHLEACPACQTAPHELTHINTAIPALLPVAVLGWPPLLPTPAPTAPAEQWPGPETPTASQHAALAARCVRRPRRRARPP